MNPSAPIQELLQAYPILTPQPVQWGELDIAHIVNNTVYGRWSENARSAYFLAWQPQAFAADYADPHRPVMGELTLTYVSSVQFPDTVWMGTRIRDIQADRYVMETLMVSQRTEQVVAKAQALLVHFDFVQQQKANLPADFAEQVAAFEQVGK